MRTRIPQILSASLALILACTVPSYAQEYTDTGRSVTVMKVVATIEALDGSKIERLIGKGFALADDPGSPLYMINQNCAFTNITGVDGSEKSGGFCDGIDADGNVFWVVTSADDNAGNWHYLGGTGRFSNIEGGGTYTTAREWADGKVVITWDGTYTLN